MIAGMIFDQLDQGATLIIGQIATPGHFYNYGVQSRLSDTIFIKLGDAK